MYIIFHSENTKYRAEYSDRKMFDVYSFFPAICESVANKVPYFKVNITNKGKEAYILYFYRIETKTTTK